MPLVPVLLSVWGVSLALMLGVSIYVARVGRNEEAQIFLAESSNHVKTEQDEIAARVGKLQPLKPVGDDSCRRDDFAGGGVFRI